MTDGVLKRLAQLERRHRQAGEHREIGHVEQRWAEPGEYAAAVRALMVEAHLPVWDEGGDVSRWCEQRGLTLETIVVRLDALMVDHPGLAGVGRAEVRNAVLSTPATVTEQVANWCQLNGGVS